MSGEFQPVGHQSAKHRGSIVASGVGERRSGDDVIGVRVTQSGRPTACIAGYARPISSRIGWLVIRKPPSGRSSGPEFGRWPLVFCRIETTSNVSGACAPSTEAPSMPVTTTTVAIFDIGSSARLDAGRRWTAGLATVGAFRVISTPRRPRSSVRLTLRRLAPRSRPSLAQTARVPGSREHAVSLTKDVHVPCSLGSID